MVNTPSSLFYIVGVTEAEKKEIVDYHNKVRRDVTDATDMQVLVGIKNIVLPSSHDLYVPYYNTIYLYFSDLGL